jgi:phenylpyruvate tautomerase PptA (4-oxalocrotonate tautomerase family)
VRSPCQAGTLFSINQAGAYLSEVKLLQRADLRQRRSAMSFVSTKVAESTPTPEHIRRLQEQLTTIAAKALGVVPELMAVLIQQVAVQGWSVAAEPVRIAAHVEAKVAAGLHGGRPESVVYRRDKHAPEAGARRRWPATS